MDNGQTDSKDRAYDGVARVKSDVTPRKLTTSDQIPEMFLNPWLITTMLSYTLP